MPAAGGDLFADLGGGTFDGQDPEVIRAMLAQSQKFATAVNETTWEDLRRTFADGIGNGESLPQLQERIEATFRQYMSEPGADADELAAKISRSEMIARTETTRAWNKGSLEAARQNPNVGQKQWVAANDARTRPEHSAAHGQTVDKDEDFEVGGESCEGPGDPNLSAEQSINCRCTVRYVTGAFVDKPLAQFDDKGNLIP
jgi:SPP1 gp7 family putative phage head morphogenesis protein